MQQREELVLSGFVSQLAKWEEPPWLTKPKRLGSTSVQTKRSLCTLKTWAGKYHGPQFSCLSTLDLSWSLCCWSCSKNKFMARQPTTPSIRSLESLWWFCTMSSVSSKLYLSTDSQMTRCPSWTSSRTPRTTGFSSVSSICTSSSTLTTQHLPGPVTSSISALQLLSASLSLWT